MTSAAQEGPQQITIETKERFDALLAAAKLLVGKDISARNFKGEDVPVKISVKERDGQSTIYVEASQPNLSIDIRDLDALCMAIIQSAPGYPATGFPYKPYEEGLLFQTMRIKMDKDGRVTVEALEQDYQRSFSVRKDEGTGNLRRGLSMNHDVFLGMENGDSPTLADQVEGRLLAFAEAIMAKGQKTFVEETAPELLGISGEAKKAFVTLD